MSDGNDDYVVTLGSKGGASLRPGTSMPSSNLLLLNGEMIVVDCGLGVTTALLNQGVALRTLKTIFITHMHCDHYLELGPLLYGAWMSGLKTPVTVYGPEGLKDYWIHFLKAMQVDKDLRVHVQGRIDLAELVSVVGIEAGPLAYDGPINVNVLNTDHPPLEDTFAYRFEGNGKAIVFSGDTSPISAMAEFSQGADVLVHEGMLSEKLPDVLKNIGGDFDKMMHHITQGHSEAGKVAQIAAQAGVGQLVINHLIPPLQADCTELEWQRSIEPHFGGALSVARDGLKVPF